MTKLELVVARYKEDIEWIDIIKPLGLDITVYNKYSGDNLLPNVGRESHTYLHHIISKWNNLADVTIFVQGNPFEHSTDFLKQVFEISQKNIGFIPIASSHNGNLQLIVCDLNGQPHGCIKGNPIPVGKLYEWLMCKTSPDVYVATPGAQFAVSRDVIHLNPLSFYEKAITSLSYSSDPIEGHCFERMWPTIFKAAPLLKYDVLNYQAGEPQFNSMGMTTEDYLKSFVGPDSVKLAGELGSDYWLVKE